MNSILVKLLTDLAVIAVLSALVWLVENKMKKLLPFAVNTLVYWAEEKIQGSKMGPERKAWVIARLEEAGFKVTDTVGKLIDALVSVMNAKKAALETEAADSASSAVGEAIDAIEEHAAARAAQMGTSTRSDTKTSAAETEGSGDGKTNLA